MGVRCRKVARPSRLAPLAPQDEGAFDLHSARSFILRCGASGASKDAQRLCRPISRPPHERPRRTPALADIALVPALTVLTAFIVSGLVVLAIGENPVEAIWGCCCAARSARRAAGLTRFYYTTSFIFTGLAVAIAFQAGLFNIGGEGQATFAGVGIALVVLQPRRPADAAHAAAGGARRGAGRRALGRRAGYLQAKRGSHVVITTIMFNFIRRDADGLSPRQRAEPARLDGAESRNIPPEAILLPMNVALGWLGISFPRTPFNLSFLLRWPARVGVWILVWHTRLGYEIRVVGASSSAANYAGIRPERIIIVAMAISGALAGLLAVNEVMGVQHRLVLEFAAGPASSASRWL